MKSFTSALLASLLIISFKLVGHTVVDENGWLEKDDSKTTKMWISAQNNRTARLLVSSQRFRQMRDSNLKIMANKDRILAVSRRNGYYYNFWQDDFHIRGIYRRTAVEEFSKPEPKWETVFDLDSLAKVEGEDWVYKGIRCLFPAYEKCMVFLSKGGGDKRVSREFNIVQKRFVENGFYIANAKSRLSWNDDNSLLVGTDMGPGTLTSAGYPRMPVLWKRGTKLADAEVLYKGESDSVSAGAYKMYTLNSSVTMLYENRAFHNTAHFLLDSSGKRHLLNLPVDTKILGYLNRKLFIQLRSDWSLPGKAFKKGSVLEQELAAVVAQKSDYTVLFEPTNSIFVKDVNFTKNTVLINTLNNVSAELWAYRESATGWKRQSINLGEQQVGTITVMDVNDVSDDFVVEWQSFLEPNVLFSVNALSMEKTNLRSVPDFFDAHNYKVVQEFATSSDGTKVPYFLVYPRRMQWDGLNCTLLHAYGGFEKSVTPHYSGMIGQNWLSEGCAYVVANIRGGGEFGPDWHKSAIKGNRYRVFQDLEGVVKDLFARGVTSPEYLGINGASNGGLLVGVALTRHPELYGAAVAEQPLMDMRRYSVGAGKSWRGEYGDPDIPSDWSNIKTWSPYHNILKSKKYPPFLLTSTATDDRVAAWHSRKMVKRMLDLEHRETFYFEDLSGGHSGASDILQEAKLNAMIFAFLLEKLKRRNSLKF